MSRSIGFQDARYVTSPEQNFQGRVGILENFLHCKKTWQPAFFFRCHVISIVWWTIVTPLNGKGYLLFIQERVGALKSSFDRATAFVEL
jgi:hypothetical protein